MPRAAEDGRNGGRPCWAGARAREQRARRQRCGRERGRCHGRHHAADAVPGRTAGRTALEWRPRSSFEALDVIRGRDGEAAETGSLWRMAGLVRAGVGTGAGALGRAQGDGLTESGHGPSPSCRLPACAVARRRRRRRRRRLRARSRRAVLRSFVRRKFALTYVLRLIFDNAVCVLIDRLDAGVPSAYCHVARSACGGAHCVGLVVQRDAGCGDGGAHVRRPRRALCRRLVAPPPRLPRAAAQPDPRLPLQAAVRRVAAPAEDRDRRRRAEHRRQRAQPGAHAWRIQL